MEINTLQALITYIVVTLGAGGLSVWILNLASTNPQAWFEKLSYGAKRVIAMLFAVIVVTVLWVIAILLFGYFDVPGSTWQEWLEAWTILISPSIVSQQVIHGFVREKKVEVEVVPVV